jgi:hypothetical protein
MFQAMAIVGNLGLEIKTLKTILTIMEGEKHGCCKYMKHEQEGYAEYKQHIVIWKKQKKETKEKVNAKMLQLTIKNKELKMRMMEWTKL